MRTLLQRGPEVLTPCSSKQPSARIAMRVGIARPFFEVTVGSSVNRYNQILLTANSSVLRLMSPRVR